MHAGSIDNPKSAAGRVYAILRFCQGRWLSGWYLTTEARVTAVGTRVSEVRHQLPAGRRIEHKTSHEGVSGSWYRLVVDVEPQESSPVVFKITSETPKEPVRMLINRPPGQLGTVAPQMELDIQGI